MVDQLLGDHDRPLIYSLRAFVLRRLPLPDCPARPFPLNAIHRIRCRGWGMADNHHAGADQQQGHPAMDYAEHEKTYKMFLLLTKWGIIFNVAVLVLMAIFLL
jgi:hypothetical protein